MAVANLDIGQATVTTLGTVMIIGLGFLQRPSRASLLWSMAFVLSMVSTWVIIGGQALEIEAIRRAGLGLMLGAPALVWSGFRARRGARGYAWIAAVQAVGSALVLVGLTDPQAYSVGFRSVFFGASLFAALTLLELHRSPDRHERLVMPLRLVSGAFALLGAFTFISAFLFPADRGDGLGLVRLLNTLGLLVYLVSATVTLLFLTSVSAIGVHSARSWSPFTVIARDRLTRAQHAGESSWVVLSVRIDDPEEIRAAAGEASFVQIVERFERTVVDALPAEADVGREARGRLVVVLSRPGPVIREHVREMLREVTEMDAAQQIAVRLSASVGWAPADTIGYDFESLLTAAQRACDEASSRGGDRWQRVGA